MRTWPQPLEDRQVGKDYELLPAETAELSYAELRKRERPFVLPLDSENTEKVERAAYDAAYKGVTDALTLYLWRKPAFYLTRWAARAGLSADSEIERYLRALQVAGIISPDVAWSARPFSPRIADSLLPRSAAHPWARAFDWSPELQRSGIDIVPISVGLGGNSAFPFGVNDGPVWAGRGATAKMVMSPP